MTELQAQEQIVQVAVSGSLICLLTNTGRVFTAERGRKALGWQLLDLPALEAAGAADDTGSREV